MEALIIYILKASGVLFLFLITYELLLKKETFFNLNRAFLFSGLVLAVVLPLIVIREYIVLEPSNSALMQIGPVNSVDAVSNSVSGLSLKEIFYAILLTGIGFMMVRFVLQLASIGRILRGNRLIRIQGYTLVEIKKDLAPFSFFNYIFFNPEQYEEEELEAVLEHEKVHCRQWHSIDVLLAQLVLILLWINPLSWLYLRSVKQNLEFLADSNATRRVASRKNYQYTMLKISGNLQVIPVTNNFYNSLIKKRIVMLHQSKSSRLKMLKTLVILPVLAVFLWSFNTETVYLPPEADNTIISDQFTDKQSVEIKIDKDTSDEELLKIKKDLAKKGIDFSYTAVHNEDREIIDLNITLTSNKKKGKTFTGTSNFENNGEPIDPVIIVFDEDNNFFFMSDDGDKHQVVHTEKNYSTWVHSDDDAHQVIEVYKDNGKEVIKVNGKKVSRKELEKMEKEGKIHMRHVMIDSDDNGERNTVIIRSHEAGTDHDIDHDVEIISADGGGFVFMNDVNEEWLIMLDGKEVDMEDIRDLEPDDIETINVLKGKSAAKKYGNKAESGALEITTKN